MQTNSPISLLLIYKSVFEVIFISTFLLFFSFWPLCFRTIPSQKLHGISPKGLNSAIAAYDTLTFLSWLLWIVHNLKYWSNECMVAWHTDHQKCPIKSNKTTMHFPVMARSIRENLKRRSLSLTSVCTHTHTHTSAPLITAAAPPSFALPTSFGSSVRREMLSPLCQKENFSLCCVSTICCLVKVD